MDDGRMCRTSLEMPNIHLAINQLIKQTDVTTVSIPRMFVHVSGWTNIKQARYFFLTHILFWGILRTSMYIQAFKLIISECVTAVLLQVTGVVEALMDCLGESPYKTFILTMSVCLDLDPRPFPDLQILY